MVKQWLCPVPGPAVPEPELLGVHSLQVAGQLGICAREKQQSGLLGLQLKLHCVG